MTRKKMMVIFFDDVVLGEPNVGEVLSDASSHQLLVLLFFSRIGSS